MVNHLNSFKIHGNSSFLGEHLAFYLPSLRGGGAEKVLLTLANAFAERGLRVDLVLTNAVGEYMPQVSHKVRLVDLRANRVLASLPGLVRYLRRERPRAMLSALGHANVVALWARLFSGAPTKIVISEHYNWLQILQYATDLRTLALKTAIKSSCALADKVVAVSKGVAEEFAQVTGYPLGRIQVIYNPVNLTYIQEQTKYFPDCPWFEPGEPPVILGVGRLTGAKDFSTLIRAFAKLRRAHASRLMILGEGKLRGELEDLARHLGIETDVAMPGFVDNPFVFMRNASLFVLTSRREGFGNVLVEAMACGTPVVSTDCPSGPAEILENGKWGRLVPIGDVDALAEAMAATLDEPEPPEVAGRAADFNVDQAVEGYLQALFPQKDS